MGGTDVHLNAIKLVFAQLKSGLNVKLWFLKHDPRFAAKNTARLVFAELLGPCSLGDLFSVLCWWPFFSVPRWWAFLCSIGGHYFALLVVGDHFFWALLVGIILLCNNSSAGGQCLLTIGPRAWSHRSRRLLCQDDNRWIEVCLLCLGGFKVWSGVLNWNTRRSFAIYEMPFKER